MGLIGRIKGLLGTVEQGGVGSEDSTQVTIPAGVFRSIPSGSQEVIYGELAVTGNMDVAGELRIYPWA